MKLENAQETLLNESPLKISQQFNRDELLDLREQLKAKRAALIESKDKCANGNSIALMNVHLSEVKTMLSRVNQTISLHDHDAKLMKKSSPSTQEMAMHFYRAAEKELDAKTFNKIKEKAKVA